MSDFYKHSGEAGISFKVRGQMPRRAQVRQPGSGRKELIILIKLLITIIILNSN